MNNEGSYVWHEGEEDEEKLDYSAWCGKEPTNSNQQEHCVHLWTTGHSAWKTQLCSFVTGRIWNDSSCLKEMGFICEI